MKQALWFPADFLVCFFQFHLPNIISIFFRLREELHDDGQPGQWGAHPKAMQLTLRAGTNTMKRFCRN